MHRNYLFIEIFQFQAIPVQQVPLAPPPPPPPPAPVPAGGSSPFVYHYNIAFSAEKKSESTISKARMMYIINKSSMH